MTQPETTPEQPKNGENWWVRPIKRPENLFLQKWNYDANYYCTPIARVLTPDEIALKDAEIAELNSLKRYFLKENRSFSETSLIETIESCLKNEKALNAKIERLKTALQIEWLKASLERIGKGNGE